MNRLDVIHYVVVVGCCELGVGVDNVVKVDGFRKSGISYCHPANRKGRCCVLLLAGGIFNVQLVESRRVDDLRDAVPIDVGVSGE